MPKDIAIETTENQLDISCDVTWSILMAVRGILHPEFAVGKSPRRIAD